MYSMHEGVGGCEGPITRIVKLQSLQSYNSSKLPRTFLPPAPGRTK